VANASFLDAARSKLGATRGNEAYEDLRGRYDPETATTTTRSFPYQTNVSVAKPKGMVRIVNGSFRSTAPKLPASTRAAAARAATADHPRGPSSRPATSSSPRAGRRPPARRSSSAAGLLPDSGRKSGWFAAGPPRGRALLPRRPKPPTPADHGRWRCYPTGLAAARV
jgi:hypothetical protein